MTPRVSVVMPVFNGARYIDSAIESILGQTYGDFEYIIVDDGSSDGTGELVEKWGGRDSRIRFLKGQHAGVTVALNQGLADASGEFVARMDADDVALPRRFENQVKYLDNSPNVVAVGTAIELMDPEGESLCVQPWAENHEAIDEQLLRGKGGLSHPAAMIRRADLMNIGGYREEFRYAQDKDLWLRLAERGRLANLPDVLLRYREHSRGVGFEHVLEQKGILLEILKDAYRRRGVDHPLPNFKVGSVLSQAEQHRRWMKLALRGGFYSTALKHARASVALEPSFRNRLRLLRFLRYPRAIVHVFLRKN